MRTISSLPPDLTQLLFEAGSRAIVLVEGKEDREVLENWFPELLPELYFHDCGGFKQLEHTLKELLNRGTLKRAWGLMDRDFRSDEDVNNSHSETSHRFILRRYAMENYLLEPKPLWEVLRERHPSITNDLPNETAMADLLLNLCARLKSVMAANWVIYDLNVAEFQKTGETAKLEYFSTGHAHERDIVLERALRLIQCTLEEAETLLAEKEQIIDEHLLELERAHQKIDGKRLLHWMHREHFKTGDEEYLRRRLTREASQIPADLIAIIKTQILNRARRQAQP